MVTASFACFEASYLNHHGPVAAKLRWGLYPKTPASYWLAAKEPRWEGDGVFTV